MSPCLVPPGKQGNKQPRRQRPPKSKEKDVSLSLDLDVGFQILFYDAEIFLADEVDREVCGGAEGLAIRIYCKSQRLAGRTPLDPQSLLLSYNELLRSYPGLSRYTYGSCQ
jgi:hypothetical protein